ncbi:MAG: hypothetical protein HZA12_08025 [Nitrospirae bacterium]|nr:hypothetical protein [Nitrospirota bacterium]
MTCQYVKPEFKEDYDKEKVINFTQGDMENYLIGMMKVNFLKRLESSVNSFAISMDRTVRKIGELEKRIQEFKKSMLASEEIDLDDLHVTDGDEETEDAWEVGKRLNIPSDISMLTGGWMTLPETGDRCRASTIRQVRLRLKGMQSFPCSEN